MVPDARTAAAEPATEARRTWQLLLAANGFSLLGNYVQNLALPLWVLTVTGSYTATGVTFAVGSLPAVVCAPIAGWILDRFDRRRALISAELLSALLVLVLVGAVARENLTGIYVVVALLKAVGSISIPAVPSLLKERLAADSLRPVTALFELVFGLTLTFGPVIGAMLSAGVGIDFALWANFASFMIGGLLPMLLPRRPFVARAAPPRDAGGSTDRTTRLRWSTLDQRLRRVAVAEVAYFLFLGAEVVVALAVFQKSIGIGAAAAYQALAGVGWIVASYVIVRRAQRQTAVVWLGAAVSAAAAAAMAFNASIGAWLTVVVVGVLGGVGNVMISGGASVVYQTLTPNEIIGRVLAARRAVLNLVVTVSYIAVPVIADLNNRPALTLFALGVTNLAVTSRLLRSLPIRSAG
jgi:hypothetical protein